MQEQQQILTKDEVRTLLSISQYPSHIQISDHIPNSEQSEYSQVQCYKELIKAQTISSMFIECFYLLFTCFTHDIFPELHTQFLAFNSQKKKFVLVFKQLLRGKNLGEMMNDAVCPYFTLCYRIIKEIESSTKSYLQQNIKREQKEGGMLLISENQEFVETLQKIIKIKLVDKQSFQKTEETKYLQKYSTILNIRNYAVCLKILKDSEHSLELKKYFFSEKQNLLNLKRQKILHKHFSQTFQTQTKIQNNLKSYFETFKTNPLFVKLADIPQQTQEKIDFKNLQALEAKKIRLRIKIKSINSMPCGNKKQADQFKPIQCNIEYFIGKHLIVMRVNLNINFQGNSINQLLYKWSTLTFSDGVFGLQLVQKIQFQRKKKQLLVKAKAEVLQEQSLIIKCLKFIDMCIAISFCLEKWCVDSSNQILEDSVSYLSESYERVKHYVNIADKLCFHVYQNIK